MKKERPSPPVSVKLKRNEFKMDQVGDDFIKPGRENQASHRQSE